MAAKGSNTNNNDAGNDAEDEENLDEILASMDIDNDFNAWTSFRTSMVSSSSPTSKDKDAQPATANATPYDPDLAQWKKRLDRLEVYSTRYKPSPNEVQELNTLAASIGLGNKTFLGNLFGMMSSTAADEDSPDHRVRFEKIREQSILLFRGYAVLNTGTGTGTGNTAPTEVDVILLTHGLVLAKVKGTQENNNKNKMMVAKSFLACITWDKVDHVVACGGEITSGSNRPSMRPSSSILAFELHLKKTSNNNNNSKASAPVVWTFTVATSSQQVAWLNAFESVLVRTQLHRKSAGASHHFLLGWQYTLVHRGGFTSAVTGREDNLIISSSGSSSSHPSAVNQCDSYNGLAPLHYAVRCGHVDIARQLLEKHGADVHVKDKEGFSPIYYADRDQNQAMQQLLYEFGAEPSSRDASQCGCGELFGRIADAQEIINDRRTAQAAEAEAQAAKSQMAENMRALQQRGEKINEMGDKAAQLNEGAATYADLARQLKEKSSKPTFFGLL